MKRIRTKTSDKAQRNLEPQDLALVRGGGVGGTGAPSPLTGISGGALTNGGISGGG
jgi:hypothetical protein